MARANNNYTDQTPYSFNSRDERGFFAVCKAQGVVPSEEARRLVVNHVMAHWGMEKLLNPPAAPVERCEDTLDLPLEDDQQGEQQKHQLDHQLDQIDPKEEKAIECHE